MTARGSLVYFVFSGPNRFNAGGDLGGGGGGGGGALTGSSAALALSIRKSFRHPRTDAAPGARIEVRMASRHAPGARADSIPPFGPLLVDLIHCIVKCVLRMSVSLDIRAWTARPNQVGRRDAQQGPLSIFIWYLLSFSRRRASVKFTLRVSKPSHQHVVTWWSTVDGLFAPFVPDDFVGAPAITVRSRHPESAGRAGWI